MADTKTSTEKKKRRGRVDELTSYFCILFIASALISIMSYELVDFVIHRLYPDRGAYNPLDGLGMLLPMVFALELFASIFTRILLKKLRTLTGGMKQVADGNYEVRLDPEHAAPFTEAYTSFNQMAADLGSVQALRRDFINDFSHEFKTPITSINGFANLLLDTKVTEEERREYLQVIADESERLSHLAQDTMLLSKLETAVSIPDKAPYSLDEQIRQDLILLSPEWSKKNITVDADLEPVTYTGNASIMTHIWINLVNNAIKFTPEGGTITVRLKKAEDRIIASVADTGKGMTKEECARVFDQYWQADSSHSGKGLGLGLSIVHRILELAGGSIAVESTPGEGSIFIVTLPLQ